MSKFKSIALTKIAVLAAMFFGFEKDKNDKSFNLKKASPKDIEANRCKQYDYVA
jgi:hypothetical protein